MDAKSGMLQQQHGSDTSPSMQNSQPPAPQQYHHQYHASNGHHDSPDIYRASPSSQQQSSHATHQLPPIQHYGDGHNNMQTQPQPHYAAPPMGGAQMHQGPPPSYNPNQFPYANGVMQAAPMPSNVGANGQNGMMRFPIPQAPPDSRQLSGRQRGAKEVKRRTKTGCLTCRKRRIKCDECHPHCRNCQKSKRECLGYDPIFKQQPGPAPIQPAPASSGTVDSKSTTSSTLASTSYESPQTFPGTGGTFIPTNNPAQVDGPFEYGGASLDPALAGGNASLAMAQNHLLQSARKVKPIAMEHLFSLNDVPPRYQLREAPPPNSTYNQKEIDDFYRLHYAHGLDKLFETQWYSSRGLSHIQHDPALLDFVTQCVEQFKDRAEDMAAAQAIQSLEARLVWQFALMPRNASLSNGATGVHTDQLTTDVLPRIDTVEHLITGQFLPQNMVSPPPPAAEHQSQHTKYNEQSFWAQLGCFTSIRDDGTDPSSLGYIDQTLMSMRGLLGMMENRDVLYSLAVARHIGGRMPEFNPHRQVISTSNDSNDEMNKLAIAQKFVTEEDQRGLTQPIQRICGMAIRSWILQKQ